MVLCVLLGASFIYGLWIFFLVLHFDVSFCPQRERAEDSLSDSFSDSLSHPGSIFQPSRAIFQKLSLGKFLWPLPLADCATHLVFVFDSFFRT